MARDRDHWVLGINAYDHDTAACLLRNGAIEVAIAKERVSRVKHASGFYDDAVDYCLRAAGIPLDRVDLVVRNCYVMPVEEMERRLVYHSSPYHMTRAERERALRSPLFLAGPPRVVTVSHHLAHAYSAFAVSPFEEGVVMVVDGVGGYRADVTEPVPEADEAPPLARESESYYRFSGTRLETIRKVFMGPTRGFLSDEFFNMPGLGALYSRVATYVFGEWDKCGEVMGLAPYGRPGRAPPLMRLEDGRLEVPDWTEAMRHPFLGLSDRTWESSPHREEWEDLAWRVQDDTERVLLARARWLHETTGARNLCLAGGVALNCVANGRIVEETPFENVFVQPAAGDDGIAIGCAYYGHLALAGRKRTFVMRHAYLGRAYDRFDVAEARRPLSVKLATRRREGDVVARTADLLAAGKVVGWFQGRSEFGPRSLGNRSILADPREARMKDHVNGRVKHRQGFRPFAPAVLAERADEVFEGDAESPFMLLVRTVRPEWRARLGAVVHVDGTARVQTVREDTNPRLHALLRAFEERTGVPVLLNTSFNIRGDPIVEDPSDAMECFLLTRLDALVVHDTVFRKTPVYTLASPLVRFMAQLRRNLRSETMMERLARKVLE